MTAVVPRAPPGGAAPRGGPWAPSAPHRSFSLWIILVALLCFLSSHSRFRGGRTGTMRSATGAAVCMGAFSVSSLMVGCCLAGCRGTPRSRCWRSALGFSSVAFVNANVSFRYLDFVYVVVFPPRCIPFSKSYSVHGADVCGTPL